MQELRKKASRVLRGEGKQEKLAPDYSPENKPEPAVEPNPFTVHHDHSRSAGNRVAPWEAQKPPPVEQPRKVVKKKSSLFSLRKEKREEDKVVITDASAPPVPPIPAKFKYSLFPHDKPLSPFDVATRSTSSSQRPDTGNSGFSSRAVPHPSKATAPSKFQPIKTPYSKPSGLPHSPSKVILPSSTENPASTERHDTSRSVSATTVDHRCPPVRPTRNFTPIMSPWINSPGLPESPPRPVPWPGQSRSPSPASSVRTTVHSPQSPSNETPTTKKFFETEHTTFGVPDEVLQAQFANHPAVRRFRKMFEPGGKVSSDIVYPPGIPAVEYHKMKALYDLTGSPFNEETKSKGKGKGKDKGKKPQPLPTSSSSYSLSTITPFSVHEHTIPRSAPLNPPLPFRPMTRGAKSATSSPTSPDFAKLNSIADRKLSSSSPRPKSKETRTASTSSHRLGYNSSSDDPASRKVKTVKSKKSLRNLFTRTPPIPSLRHFPISNPIPIPPERSASPATVPGFTPEFSPGFWDRDTLVEFPIPIRVPTPKNSNVSPVPGLPAELFQYKKRAGPPPVVPARPDEKVDLEMVRMRGVGDGRMVFVRKAGGGSDKDEDEYKVRGAWVPVPHQAPPGVDMGIRKGDGGRWEKFSHERYNGVAKTERHMVLDDFVIGKKEVVEDV